VWLPIYWKEEDPLTETATPTMPRKKSKRDDDMTKFDRDLLRKARFVVAQTGGLLAEFISESARANIEARYEQVIREESGKIAKKKPRQD
jgi:hypothetical protein